MSASKSSGRASSSVRSTSNFSPLSAWCIPWIWPLFGDTILVAAPASASASRRFVISTCSNPSATRIAIFFPDNVLPIVVLAVGWLRFNLVTVARRLTDVRLSLVNRRAAHNFADARGPGVHVDRDRAVDLHPDAAAPTRRTESARRVG